MPALAQAQLAALNRLVRAIAPSNRFHRPRLAAAGGLDGFASLAEFRARMPFTSKAELTRDQIDHPPHGSTLTYPLETYVRHHQTSGTSGRPLIWLDDRASWQWVLDNWKRVWESAGATAGDAAFFAFSFGPFLGFWAAFDSAVQLGIRAIPAGGLSSAERVRFLLARRPRLLCCTPTYALRLAEVARAESLDLGSAGVERILVAGEPGGSVPAIRERIEREWPGALVVDHHGMTEIGPVSYGTPGQPGILRLMHGSYLCEVLAPGTDEPVAPGGRGELVLTTLGREACPLLRYRTGDLVEPVALPGEGPDAFALRGGILGRVDDMVIVRGVNLYPASVDAAVRAVPGIREYQVEIDRRRTLPEIKLRFEAREDGGDPAGELAKHLRATFHMRIDVEKVPAGTLPVFEMKARRWHVVS
jgi:phenylacetate-CoA ligase